MGKRDLYDENKILTGETITEFVYPIKNGIESAKQEAEKWAKECMEKIN